MTDRKAQNWSRRDNIRAGSVSGPWRSTSRDEEPAKTDEPAVVEIPSRSAGDVRETEAYREAPEPSDAMFPEEPKRVTPVKPAELPKAPPGIHKKPVTQSKGTSLTTAVFGGVVVATAIVAGAFYLQSRLAGPTERATFEPVQTASPGDIAGATGPDNAAELTQDADEIDGTNQTVATDAAEVHLRVGPNLSGERRAEIVKILEDGGMQDIRVENISFPIAVSRVGYYHEGDLDTATELADKISVFLDAPTGPVPVRNYENLVPNAPEGRIDLWIKE